MVSRKFIVYVVSKTRSVDNGKSDTNTVLLKLCNSECHLMVRYETATRRLTNVDRLDPDTFLNMSCLSIVGNLVPKDFRLAESVHKGGAPSSRGA
jgi:hypothetical protein